ncbi:hypothetical protein [Treponema pedis]|uniref:hypothetical protein n=1 Tax=Treponema pedis TaxID=409322 RepID=UPI00197DCE31|nr:hypothetical protein [Treponema pedis]QSI05084.1 hypothetical protein DYQ05_09240 [Treponema pedis]
MSSSVTDAGAELSLSVSFNILLFSSLISLIFSASITVLSIIKSSSGVSSSLAGITSSRFGVSAKIATSSKSSLAPEVFPAIEDMSESSSMVIFISIPSFSFSVSA